MAKAREIPHLAEAQSFREAAALAVQVRAEEVFEHAAGVLDMGDIERVHDMRVATRRLRAVMEIFEPAFPRKQHRAVLRDVKALADSLGERRDRDVAIDAMTKIGLGHRDLEALEHVDVHVGVSPFTQGVGQRFDVAEHAPMQRALEARREDLQNGAQAPRRHAHVVHALDVGGVEDVRGLVEQLGAAHRHDLGRRHAEGSLAVEPRDGARLGHDA